jgi:hypothetical protein
MSTYHTQYNVNSVRSFEENLIAFAAEVPSFSHNTCPGYSIPQAENTK